MYEDYLTKSLSSIIIAKQALNNYKVTNIKDMKNKAAYNTQQAIEYIVKFCIYNCRQYHNNSTNVSQFTIKPAYKVKLADVNKKLNL